MDGWDDNNHPNAYCNADPEHIINLLAVIIAETNPHVVLTHDPSGGYGHPDHKTMSDHATAAVQRASDPDGFTPLLYYVCFPRGVFQRWWQEMLDRGIEPPFAVDAIDSLGTPDNEVTTTVDVSAHVDTKIASLKCHRTQISDDGPFFQLPPGHHGRPHGHRILPTGRAAGRRGFAGDALTLELTRRSFQAPRSQELRSLFRFGTRIRCPVQISCPGRLAGFVDFLWHRPRVPAQL